LIADRTRAALAQKKAQGALLGDRTNLHAAQAKGVAANRDAADAFAANVLPIVRQIRAAGATTFRAIAKALNDRGVRTARGGDWHDSTVRNGEKVRSLRYTSALGDPAFCAMSRLQGNSVGAFSRYGRVVDGFQDAERPMRAVSVLAFRSDTGRVGKSLDCFVRTHNPKAFGVVIRRHHLKMINAGADLFGRARVAPEQRSEVFPIFIVDPVTRLVTL
jgi:hypothetical protein